MGEPAEFDEIAENIFYPAYEDIADDILAATGIREGECLDLGCGGGHLGLAYMRRTACRFVFVDRDPAAVALAGKRYKGSDCRFVCGDAADIPAGNDVFDLVISRASIPFWEEQEKSLREIFRVLKPGGWAYIGGSLGHPETERKIREKMEERHIRGKKRHRESGGSRMLTSGEYEGILRSLSCTYELIDRGASDYWIVFRKDPEDRTADE